MGWWIQDNEYVGVDARFGPTLEAKEQHSNRTRITLADPPDCCTPPRNKVHILVFIYVLHCVILDKVYPFNKFTQSFQHGYRLIVQ